MSGLGVSGLGTSIQSVLMSVRKENGPLGTRTVDPIPMDTPRPTLDLANLRCPAAVTTTRRTAMETVLRLHSTDADRKQIAALLRKFRSRQTRKLGYRYEDPDPYDKSYLFYCLDGRRED